MKLWKGWTVVLILLIICTGCASRGGEGEVTVSLIPTPTAEVGIAEATTDPEELPVVPIQSAVSEQPLQAEQEDDDGQDTAEQPMSTPKGGAETEKKPADTPKATETPAQSATKTPEATAEPAKEPEVTAKPTQGPTKEPEATAKPTQEPTKEPEATAKPTQVPEATEQPVPTEQPAATKQPDSAEPPVQGAGGENETPLVPFG